MNDKRFGEWLAGQRARRDNVGMLARAVADGTADPSSPALRSARQAAAEEFDGIGKTCPGCKTEGAVGRVRVRSAKGTEHWHPRCWSAERLRQVGAPASIVDRARFGGRVHTPGRAG